MLTIQEQLKGNLVVSCQAAPGDPLEDTETIRRIARAVTGAGARGLRINSAEHIAAIRRDTDVPIIGIQKRHGDGNLRITPDFAAAAALAKAGASIIALDCTHRTWTFGEPWRQLIERIHDRLNLPVMADVATLDEALAAEQAGADFVGSTLNGYTEETRNIHSFNWSLLADMVRQIRIPIIAEGHISTPAEAARAISTGAVARRGRIRNHAPRHDCRSLRPRAANLPLRASPLLVSISEGLPSKQGLSTGLVLLAMPLRFLPMPFTVEMQLPPVSPGRWTRCLVPRVTRASNSALGIASAGTIDAQDGSIFAATDNLPGWSGFKLREFAEQRSNLPVYVVNDAHAAALAELHFGSARSLIDFVSITIGTGIGSGIVSNGKLLQGPHGFAGSIGHHTIRFDGRPCNCGRRDVLKPTCQRRRC